MGPPRTARGGGDPLRRRVLAKAVERANKQLVQRGSVPLPAITPHSLRRTFASLLYARGEPPPVVMAEMGHTDPSLALAIYAQAMRRDDGEQDQLRALVDGADVEAPTGTTSESRDDEGPESEARPAGFEPATSRSGGGRSIH